MSLYKPGSLDPETIEHIANCTQCDLTREPRWYVCEYHAGYNQGVEDMKAVIHEYR